MPILNVPPSATFRVGNLNLLNPLVFFCSYVVSFYNLSMIPRALLAAAFVFSTIRMSAQTATSPDPHSIPAVDAGLGDCSADFIITGPDNKPVYTAKVSTRVSYGFLNSHKLDLEVGTNIDGKARFTGLPANLKHGLFFQAAEGDRTGNAFDDPSKTCKAQFAVTLRKSPQ